MLRVPASFISRALLTEAIGLSLDVLIGDKTRTHIPTNPSAIPVSTGMAVAGIGFVALAYPHRPRKTDKDEAAAEGRVTRKVRMIVMWWSRAESFRNSRRLNES